MARRFDNRPAQVALICFGMVMVCIGLGGVAQPKAADRVQGLIWLVLGGMFVWRAAVSASVVIRTDQLVLRGFVRTRRVPLQQLSSVTVAIGTTGMNGFGREYLVLHRHDATELSFKELNSKPSTTAVTVVQQAAREINSALAVTEPQGRS